MSEIYIEFIRSVDQTSAGRADHLWSEVEAAYQKPSRHYHTLGHLEHVLQELVPYTHRFPNWSTVVFAIAYHDIIYNPLKGDNEEKSSALAVKRLTEINVPRAACDDCSRLILATKKHEAADDITNLFTDADLSILGTQPDRYKRYAEEVRKEYRMFPDFLYNPGRKKVLHHFLDMPRIFKTAEFYNLYEVQARKNLQAELDALKG